MPVVLINLQTTSVFVVRASNGSIHPRWSAYFRGRNKLSEGWKRARNVKYISWILFAKWGELSRSWLVVGWGTSSISLAKIRRYSCSFYEGDCFPRLAVPYVAARWLESVQLKRYSRIYDSNTRRKYYLKYIPVVFVVDSNSLCPFIRSSPSKLISHSECVSFR